MNELHIKYTFRIPVFIIIAATINGVATHIQCNRNHMQTTTTTSNHSLASSPCDDDDDNGPTAQHTKCETAPPPTHNAHNLCARIMHDYNTVIIVILL